MIRLNTIQSFFREWARYMPLSNKDYLRHFILIIDTILILFKTSYESFLPQQVNLAIFGFDVFVYLVWSIHTYNQIQKKKETFGYFQKRPYLILGFLPFPIFRLFLLISTLKQGIIIYKYIRRGEKDIEAYLERELHFTFFDFFIDAISDAIFQRSLIRVKEVMSRLEYSQISHEIMPKYREEVKEIIRKSMNSETAIGKLDRFPLFQGIADQMSDDVANMIVETMETEAMGKIMKELNLIILEEMELHLKNLDLDRITEKQDSV